MKTLLPTCKNSLKSKACQIPGFPKKRFSGLPVEEHIE